MENFSTLDYYAMKSGDLLTFRHRNSGVIRCLQGRVLVSLQGCPTDFDLSPGVSMAIKRNPLVLIESCSEARITIELMAKPRRILPWCSRRPEGQMGIMSKHAG